jgi:hypothetical protein
MSFTTPEQTETPSAEPAVASTPTTAPDPSPVGTGPWAQDLALLFPDEATRGTVDSFLRTKVQPHTTQLEQQVAGTKDAMHLWTDLNSDPINTYVALTRELWGDAAADATLATLQQQLSTEDAAPPPAPTQEVQQTVDPRLENVLQYVESEQSRRMYDADLAKTVQAHPDVDPELFHPFVASAEGDFEKAYTLYSNWLQQYTTKHNLLPATPVPPPVMGSDASAGSAPPVAPKGQTLDEAINDFMRESRANREAPPVS